MWPQTTAARWLLKRPRLTFKRKRYPVTFRTVPVPLALQEEIEDALRKKENDDYDH